jgi:hypothetical protein
MNGSRSTESRVGASTSWQRKHPANLLASPISVFGAGSPSRGRAPGSFPGELHRKELRESEISRRARFRSLRGLISESHSALNACFSCSSHALNVESFSSNRCLIRWMVKSVSRSLDLRLLNVINKLFDGHRSGVSCHLPLPQRPIKRDHLIKRHLFAMNLPIQERRI